MTQILERLETLAAANSDHDWTGYIRAATEANRPADWDDRIARLEELLIDHTLGGRRVPTDALPVVIREAMTTADFPNVFGDALARQMLARYQGLGRALDPIFMRTTNPDFRTANIFRIDGTTQRLQAVGEKGTYTLKTRYETEYNTTLVKYGKLFDLSWEAFVNDDLGIFGGVPDDLADSAVNTEAWLMTSQFWTTTGGGTYFTHATEGAGAVSSNALTIANLEAACADMRGQASGFRNRAGEPLLNVPGYLVVPPALETTARRILQSTELRYVESAGGAATAYPTKNVAGALGLQAEPIVDPWIPVVVTSGTIGSTCWAIFSRTLKAGAIARLRGREMPEIFMKAADQMRVGGGATSPFDGDFATDNIIWKVRHCVDCATLDPRAGWASNGQ